MSPHWWTVLDDCVFLLATFIVAMAAVLAIVTAVTHFAGGSLW